jgi:hypothetical protein
MSYNFNIVSGIDSTNAPREIKVSSTGEIIVSGSNTNATAANQTTEIARLESIRDRLPSSLSSDRLKVDGSGVTQPVSVTNFDTRPTIFYSTGTISSSGDNTIISAPGAEISIYITHLILQNESSSSTTIILKDSANRLRCIAPFQGDGIAINFSEKRDFKLAVNQPLILNLSAANSCGYSIGYYTL